MGKSNKNINKIDAAFTRLVAAVPDGELLASTDMSGFLDTVTAIINGRSDADQNLMLVCAFRYALGRKTYVSMSMVNIIKDNWLGLGLGTQELIQREIRQAIELGMAGMDCDIAEWQKLLRLEICK